MFSLRPALFRVVAQGRSKPAAQNAAFWMHKQPFSSKEVVQQAGGEEELDAVTVLEQRREDMTKEGKGVIWKSPLVDQLPAAPLPEDPMELVAMDGADLVARTKADGSDRFVMIRQDKANVKQSPLNEEKRWRISFVEDGIVGEKWSNSLMGWTSNADPFQSEPPLVFENALQAVYFAKKRGWKYIVKEPIKRQVRDDGAQYQDNFLPQAVAARVAKERTNCDQWKRSASGASHYYRPLKYHGKGVVPQYGNNPDQETAPHTEAYFKTR
jgi:ETC complex I subunit conserved region